MAFTLPDFNLSLEIWGNSTPFTGSPRVTTTCALVASRRTLFLISPGGAVDVVVPMWLLLPLADDIRGYPSSGSGDYVQVNGASKNRWHVQNVVPVALGHPNEHQQALVYPFGYVTPPLAW
jgi:hypothetical protein